MQPGKANVMFMKGKLVNFFEGQSGIRMIGGDDGEFTNMMEKFTQHEI